MEIHDIITRCPKCAGTGVEHYDTIVDGEVVRTNDVTCRRCNGGQEVSVAKLHNDLIDLLEDMNDKINDIFEKVNE